MADATWGPLRPFDIDGEQLDGMTPQQCFVLGYELAQIDSLVKLPEGFERPVHSANRQRIEVELRKESREYSLTFMQDDVSESWMWLAVKAKE